MKTLRKDFDQLHEEYGTLLEIHRETAEERDSFFTRLQEAERSHTPRPNWAKCSGATCTQHSFAYRLYVCRAVSIVRFLMGSHKTSTHREKHTSVRSSASFCCCRSDSWWSGAVGLSGQGEEQPSAGGCASGGNRNRSAKRDECLPWMGTRMLSPLLVSTKINW